MDHELAPGQIPPPPLIPTRGLTRLILCIVGVYSLVQIVHIAVMAWLRAAAETGESLSPLLAALDHLQVRLPLVSVLLYFFAGTCFLFLVARLARNLPALGSASSLTPSDAVVSFLIPFVNLVRGYQTVQTLWTESQPARHPDLKPRPAPLLAWWWGSYLLLGVSSRAIAKQCALPGRYTYEQWVTSSYWLSSQCVLDLVAGGLFMLVVYLLDSRQRAQHDDLMRRVPVPPRDDLLR